MERQADRRRIIEELERRMAADPKLRQQIAALRNYREVYWENPQKGQEAAYPFTLADIDDAEARLQRFAPYLRAVFPETAETGGIIESPLRPIPRMAEYLGVRQPLYLKCDSHLPISGSIKARGGIYEVLKLAESIAADHGMLTREDDYSKLAGKEYRALFSRYRVAVGSTGNLGLSIGIISAQLGFAVTVHMSADARQWKKDLLRQKGVNVIEYAEDYEAAVAAGRRQAAADPSCHFVDDENSEDLFLGYAVAGKRLARQLQQQAIPVDEEHPLFVYLPCGVGGAPGGVAFGLKTVLGSHVHCILAEPTHAPCMTLGLLTGLQERIAVGDLGLDGKTAADGLAVGRPSALVSRIAETLVDGCYTIADESLYRYLAVLADREAIWVEPSACAGFAGPVHRMHQYADRPPKQPVHIVWATGGNMVPEEELKMYYDTAKRINRESHKDEV